MLLNLNLIQIVECLLSHIKSKPTLFSIKHNLWYLCFPLYEIEVFQYLINILNSWTTSCLQFILDNVFMIVTQILLYFSWHYMTIESNNDLDQYKYVLRLDFFQRVEKRLFIKFLTVNYCLWESHGIKTKLRITWK